MISTDKDAGKDFAQARGWTEHQIAQLTEAQRVRFEEMKKDETKRRAKVQKERKATQRQFDQHQKKKKVDQVLNLSPRGGLRVPDHIEKNLALKLRDQADTLDQMQQQFTETVKAFLQQCENERRAQDKAKEGRAQFEKSAAREKPERASPSFNKAARGIEPRQAGDQSGERSSGDTKSAQAQKDRILARRKAREQAKDRDRGQGRER